MKKIILSSVILSAMLLSACGSVSDDASHTSSRSDTNVSATATTDETSSDESSDDMSYPDVVASYDIAKTYEPYYQFMLQSQEGQNAVFSSESLNSAFCMYEALLTDTDAKEVSDFLNDVDYLAYHNTSVFKTVNRLWVNSTHPDFNIDAIPLPSDIVYPIDMSSPKSTDEKNDFVNQQTNGFITSTPSVFTSDMLFDAMNITYFKDTWYDGDKKLSDEPMTFHNIDGTDVDLNMIEEHASDAYVTISDNACAYTIPYDSGFTFTAILPDEGHDLSEIDIDSFVSGRFDTKSYSCVNFYMPEFETESIYQCKLQAFDLSAETMNPSIFAQATAPADILQVAKIRVDHDGTEAAAVSEIMKTDAAAILDEYTEFDMICDRPFAYYIYDTENGDVAFMGVVTMCS